MKRKGIKDSKGVALHYGDKVTAVEGTPSEWLARGREGVICELRDVSDACANNLLRWGYETITMGFYPENVSKVGVA